MNGDTVQIEVPRSALVAAFLEKVARASGDVDGNTHMQDRAALLPPITGSLDGGIYAGITVHSNLPMALVLLPGDEEMPWAKARDWAKSKGGNLPSRYDALTLWQNVPREFKKEAYWTSEEYAGYADYAWLQNFYYGNQDGYHKSSGFRCRAVRRVPL